MKRKKQFPSEFLLCHAGNLPAVVLLCGNDLLNVGFSESGDFVSVVTELVGVKNLSTVIISNAVRLLIPNV